MMSDKITDSTEIEFTINVKIQKRWVPCFLSMLKLMEHYGKIGASRRIAFYSDGDGNFQPKFTWPKILGYQFSPTKNDNGDISLMPDRNVIATGVRI